MNFLFELAALASDNGLAPEESMELSEEPLSGFVLLSVLFHVVGLLGYFAFPPVCLRLFREFTTQRPGWKKAAASAGIGIILAIACQAAVGLLLYSLSMRPHPLYLDDNALQVSLAGQMAVKYLGPLLLSVPVFLGLRTLLRKKGLATLVPGFCQAYLLLFCVPFAGFMLFTDYAKLLEDPEFLLRPAEIYMGFGLAAVPVFFLLLRSLVRQAKTAPRPRLAAAIAAYIAIPLFPISAWLFSHLCYAGLRIAALWPDTVIQTLADYSLVLTDSLWAPLAAALVTVGALRLCSGRVISSVQGMLAEKIVFLCAASIYIINACLLFFGGFSCDFSVWFSGPCCFAVSVAS